MANIIALGGQKQNGKSTASKLISERINGAFKPDVKIFSFAKRIKDMCVAFTGLDPRHFYGTEKDKEEAIPASRIVFSDLLRISQHQYVSGTTGRQLMQMIADATRAQFGDDIFTQLLACDIFNSQCKVAIIDDLRFENELSFIRKSFDNVIAIKVVRRSIGKPFAIVDNHNSENSMPDDKKFDQIWKNFSIKGLTKDVEKLVGKINEGY